MKNLTNYILSVALILGLAVVIFYSTRIQQKKETPLVETPQELQNQMTDEPVAPPEGKLALESKLKVPVPEMMIDIEKKYMAIMNTSEGQITIQLNPKDAPKTVNNFVYLSSIGFYDGLIFHRVIDGFMIQGGDPLGNGEGGPGYQFEDEISVNNKNIRGSIAMANSGPNTNGSQFFINQVDNNYLDAKHTVFGNIIEGLNIVDKIASIKDASPVIIDSITIAQE